MIAKITEAVRSSLIEFGQVAAERPCSIEGYREFVSVYSTPRGAVINCDSRFPYLAGAEIIYRAIRFRVNSDLIENDTDVGPNDLVGLQEVFLPTEDSVAYILSVWKVEIDELLPPKYVDIPV